MEQNPLEYEFHAAWHAEVLGGETWGAKMLSAIWSPDPNYSYIPTEDDLEKAATLIQWLGSPVGHNFIKQVMENYERNHGDS